jgi:NitT/TauT family transport system substrate-binding protein
MTRLIVAAMAALLLGPAVAPSWALAQDRVTFGLDWKAEAEYGGYYAAAATGIYARHGLAVTIRQGGPQVNQAQLLLAGRLDLDITSNSFLALNFVREKLPFRAVAAMFQKDPVALLTHPGQGNDSFAALRGKPIYIGADTRAGWWTFLRAKYGYSDSQIRPYTFNLAPFLADPTSAVQGYITSEPYSIRQEAHVDPVVLMISDAGYAGYGSLIAASDAMIRDKPDVIQRFIDASIEGWMQFLHGDPQPAFAAIKADNPEMSDGLLQFGHDRLRDVGVVQSGDALTLGIGAMTAARWQQFLHDAAAVIPQDTDVVNAYTLQFVNKGAGLAKP